MHYVDPVSLYIVTKPNDKARLKPLVRIVVNMIGDMVVYCAGFPAIYGRQPLYFQDPSGGESEATYERAVSAIQGFLRLRGTHRTFFAD